MVVSPVIASLRALVVLVGWWVALGACAPGLHAQQPSSFQWILWTDRGTVAERYAAVRALGFAAVPLARGADPAPVVAAGLGYYLDQPLGKGVLELRDEQWQPVREAYERTRDPAVLLRPGCLQQPGKLLEWSDALAAEVRRVAGPGLRFIALADEASATRHDAPLDTCHCPACLAAFRRWAQQRYRKLEAYNELMGTRCGSWEEVVPMTTDQVRRRELGDTVLPRQLQPFAAHRRIVAEQYAAALAVLAAAARAAAPGVPVGCTGVPVPAAFGGNEPARLAAVMGIVEPYPAGGNLELWRSLRAPGTQLFTTLFAPKPDSPEALLPLESYLRARCVEMAKDGMAGAVVWNDAAVFAEDGSRSAFGVAWQRAAASLATELDACAGAVPVPPSCWLVESQPAVQAWWMLDSARDGMTWPRRLASYEGKHSTSQAARAGWSRLLQDLGLQPHFVAAEGLAERLLQERPRCLILPAAIALDDVVVQAISNYVRDGGTLLADHSAALYDGDLQLRPAGGLDNLFGIQQRSLRWDDLAVRQGTAGTMAARLLPLAERELWGTLGQRRREGDAFLEHRTGRGRAVYLNAPVCDYPALRLAEAQVEKARELRRRVRAVLQQAGVEPPCEVRGAGLPTCIERMPLRLRDGRQVLVLRLHALEQPAVLRELAQKPAYTIEVEWPKARRWRELGGEDLGEAQRLELRLPVYGGLFLEAVR